MKMLVLPIVALNLMTCFVRADDGPVGRYQIVQGHTCTGGTDEHYFLVKIDTASGKTWWFNPSSQKWELLSD
jgi:hypothetical protein